MSLRGERTRSSDLRARAVPRTAQEPQLQNRGRRTCDSGTRGEWPYSTIHFSYDSSVGGGRSPAHDARRPPANRLSPLESVRTLQTGLQSFLSMRRIEARRKNAKAFRLRHSQSLARRRQRLSQAMVRSTIQRLGKTTKLLT